MNCLLKDRVAIVTGGGSGIGRATALLFARHGAKVVIADWNKEAGDKVCLEIAEQQADPSAVVMIQADVSNEEAVAELIRRAIGSYNKIDIVFNNASIPLAKPLEAFEEAEWERLMNVNLKSVYLMVKHTIGYLKQRRGTIVNMASLNGLYGQNSNAVYAATKGGVIALTKSLALDYAADGVRVNCVCPAGVLTPLLEAWIQQQEDPAATRKSLEIMHPLGRIATPDDIALSVLYLASGFSSFVTGVALPVDGGASLGY